MPIPPKDLADFHMRWHAFRPGAVKLMANQALSSEDAELLGWLIALADRVDKNDVAPDDP